MCTGGARAVVRRGEHDAVGGELKLAGVGWLRRQRIWFDLVPEGRQGGHRLGRI